MMFIGCSSEPDNYVNIPQPKIVQQNTQGVFTFNEDISFTFAPGTEEFQKAAEVSIKSIEKYTGFEFNRGQGVNKTVANRAAITENKRATTAAFVDKDCVFFQRNDSVQSEGFIIDVTENKITVQASDYAGAFYAYQWIYNTLLLQDKTQTQTKTHAQTHAQTQKTLPIMHIEDYPSTAYRGAMLDVARSFFTVDEVKKFIDMIAMHRLNHFHWHLTDDQGWRVEIKAYPELTRIGSQQKKGSPLRDGFYTQEEIKDIINYAEQRAITIIPEIDMPGHSSAALASYPKLGCTGGPYEVASEPGGVHRDVLCLGNDFTWKFAKDVLTEIASLFPAPYIHIGGDEVPRTRWENCKKCQRIIRKFGLRDVDGFSAEDLLQGKFNEQMALFLKTLNKKMIGWDEVLSDNIDSSTVIMSWRGLGRGTRALKKGHEVIFSSNGHFYFNNYQSTDIENEPVSTGGYLPMSKVFEAQWNTDNLTEEERQNILGVEACLWTSFVRSYEVMNYKMLPRLAAFADVAWGNNSRDYAEFLDRLPCMLSLYDKLGYVYSPIFFDVNANYVSNMEEKCLNVSLSTIDGAVIHYTLDGSVPTENSSIYKKPLKIKDDCVIKAMAYSRSGLASNLFSKEVKINKATFSNIELLTETHEKYTGNDGKVLLDGVRSISFHTTGMWVGYLNNPMEAVIDLGDVKTINQVVLSSFTDMSAYIMGISAVKVAVSDDGKNYESVAEVEYDFADDADSEKIIRNLEVDFDNVDARYVKLFVEGFEALPSWHSGAGSRPFFFIDEIEVN